MDVDARMSDPGGSRVLRGQIRWLAPLVSLVLGVAFALAVCELAWRLLFDRPMSVVVEDLGAVIPTGEQSIETTGIPNAGLYVRTSTGLRLKRSSRALVRNHVVSGEDVVITTNSLGFRYDEVGPKTANERRVLVLGDSVTFGGSVQQDETYPMIAEAHLNSTPRAGCEETLIRVINGGIGAVDLQNELAILMDSGFQIEPDVVLVGLYLNDARMSYALQISRFPPLVEQSYFLSWVSSKIDGLRWRSTLDRSAFRSIDTERDAFHEQNPPTRDSWFENPGGFNRLVGENFVDWGFAWSDEFWHRVEEILWLMKSAADQRDVQLAVVLFPVRYQVQVETPRDEPQQRFAEVMHRMQLPSLDLLPPLRSQYRRYGVDVFFDHCHYRPVGHRIVGEEVARFLRDLVKCDAKG